MESVPEFSVITCSIDSARFNAVTAMYRRVLASHPYEIVGIHDAKSLAEGYNRGVARARGKVFIFSHDDVEFLCPDLGDRLLKHLQDCDLIGIAGTTRLEHPMWSYAGPPYGYGQLAHANTDGSFTVEIVSAPRKLVTGIQAMDGCCIIAAASVLEKVQFDAERFKAFHLYDTDFTFSAYLAGFRLGIGCDLPMIHYSRGSMNETWKRDAEIFMAKRGAQMAPFRKQVFRQCEVRARSREEVLELMTPPHWT
jgi:hypothetical protein